MSGTFGINLNRSLIMVFVLLNFSFSQTNQDSSFSSDSKFDLIIGASLLYGNYTFGIKDGSEKGYTTGYSLSLNLLNETTRKVSLELGSLKIAQKSSRFCEGAGLIDRNFNENICKSRCRNFFNDVCKSQLWSIN